MPTVLLRHALAPLSVLVLLAACTASQDTNAAPSTLVQASSTAMATPSLPVDDGEDADGQGEAAHHGAETGSGCRFTH